MSKRKPRTSLGKVFLYVFMALAGIAVIGTGGLFMADIGGSMVVDMAAKAVKEQTDMTLSVGGVRGNPLRGYVLNEVSLASAGAGERIFSAKTLEASLNFVSLFRGSPRLALLAVSSVDMDLNRLFDELAKIETSGSGSSGSTEVPIDRVSLRDSRFTSQWGVIEVAGVSAAIKGTFLDAALAGAVNGVPVSGTLGAGVREKAVGVSKAEFRVGKGLLNMAGSVALDAGPDGAALDFQGTARGLDAAELAALCPSLLLSEDYAGKLDLDFTVEGAGSNLLVAAALDFEGSQMGGYPLSALSARMKYANMRLTVEEVKATALGIPIEGTAAAVVRPDSTFSIMVKLEGGSVPLSELAKLYPDLGKVGGAVERFAVNVQGPVDSLSGTVELSAPSLVLMGKRVDNLAFQVKLAKSDTASVSGKFVLEGAQAYLQGSIASILKNKNLNLTFKLSNLDVKKVADLIPDGKSYALTGNVNVNLAIQGKVMSPTVSGTFSSPLFSAMGQQLDKPSLSFSYGKDTFTLKESSGSWNGLPIKASGTIGPLSSSAPSIDMTAQLTFKPETLKALIPDVDAYKLQGTVNARVKVTGKLPQPQLSLAASSPALSALGAVSVKDLEVTTALGADMNKIDLSLKAASGSAGGVGLQALSAAVKKDGQQVSLQNVSARSGEGTLSGGGTAVLGAKDAELNLAFDFRQLDLAPLAQTGGLGFALTGKLSGKLGVTGPSSNPSVSFTGQAPSVSAEGVTFTDLSANVSGNMKTLNIKEFRANAGGAPLSAAGSVSLEPFAANVNISGNGLDLAALSAGMPDLKDQVSGKIDLSFNVKSTARGVEGTGSLRSAAVTAFGVKIGNAVFPLSLGENVLKSEGGTLDLYDGKVTNTLAFNLSTQKFSDTLKATDVDVNALAQDASGGLGGKITGKGSLSLKIDGSAAKDLTYSGSGQFDMGAGSITGFTGLNLLGTLYGVEGIRYVKAAAPLKIETGRLTIGKGASMTPPANDPIYKSAQLIEDGAVTFDKKFYFVANANMNFQLINALAGGTAGGIDTLIRGGGLQNIGKNLESALKDALSAGKAQGQEADFRDVTAKTTGTFDSPSFSILKVGPSAKQPAVTTPAAQPSKPEEIIREKIIEAIVPPEPSETPQLPAPPTNAGEVPPPPSEKNIEEQVRERVEKEAEQQIRKGLQNLFKK
ncbi:MAG: hypothetical protein LBC93_09055 [Synergistaceae bacterium]|jgi:translocation and assembly module TamB|nr:hypothetical protein [Synergistaceae bacterium]